jgi:hypothetical protein
MRESVHELKRSDGVLAVVETPEIGGERQLVHGDSATSGPQNNRGNASLAATAAWKRDE